jgi:hypothetical protein
VFPPMCPSYTRLLPTQWHGSSGTKRLFGGDRSAQRLARRALGGANRRLGRACQSVWLSVVGFGPTGPIDFNGLTIDFALDGNERVEELVGDVGKDLDWSWFGTRADSWLSNVGKQTSGIAEGTCTGSAFIGRWPLHRFLLPLVPSTDEPFRATRHAVFLINGAIKRS